MNKYQYLLQDMANTDLADFEKQLLEGVVPGLLDKNPSALKVSYSYRPPPKLTVLPLRKQAFALVSVWHESDPTPTEWQSGATAEGWAVAGYQVDESIPLGYEKTWPDGEVSPGVVLLTLLKKNPKLTQEGFMHEWHGRHTPKAIRIHPFWNYIRNVMMKPVIASSPHFDGFVEEHFKTEATLLNPMHMFGGPLRFIPHMIEVGLHAKHFLDLKNTENYLLREVHIKS